MLLYGISRVLNSKHFSPLDLKATKKPIENLYFYTHPQTVSDVTVQPPAQPFHASDFVIVNPSTDELVEF